jgi:hypothetical protein
MEELMMRKAIVLVATSFAWASTALAAEPPLPVVTATPMSNETTGVEAHGSQPSDLPASDTTSWVNRPLLITSSILLVGSYVPMASVAFTSDRPADQTNLYYPIVGPWMNLADRQCDTRPCGNEALTKVLLVADGIGQGLGAIGVVSSFFLPGKTTRHWYLIGDDRVHAGPSRVGMAGYGLGAAGTF